MAVSINDYPYGTEEFNTTLTNIARENNFTPIDDMMAWSKDYYDNNINIYPATIMHFSSMIVNKESSDEEAIAGWILAFNSILTSKEKLEENGMSYSNQKEFVFALFKEIQQKSRFTYYHAHNYFHQHPAFVKNFKPEP